jgi:hypothetical protein
MALTLMIAGHDRIRQETEELTKEVLASSTLAMHQCMTSLACGVPLLVAGIACAQDENSFVNTQECIAGAPVLALFGELDNNIVAGKNKSAWEAALKSGNNGDYTLRILSKANHLQLEEKIGSNAEMASLQRFVQAYFMTIQDWLAKRIRGFRTSR